MRPQWFEDYTEGRVLEIGHAVVDRDELLEFAHRYDPQPFHTDPEAAARSVFGGLITSGFHTCALMMRMLADHYLDPVSSLGSPGVDELRWPRPVRPGDRLRLKVTIVEAGHRRADRRLAVKFRVGPNQDIAVERLVRGVSPFGAQGEIIVDAVLERLNQSVGGLALEMDDVLGIDIASR